ncbi:MAG: ABC transporter ATP-binding protein/permease [Anaerolineales bacterium]|jgi:ATP-binding cassette subfamily B protein|nr:ABC transporter ATP-binding protein/permease [Anaerolineales bacterium]
MSGNHNSPPAQDRTAMRTTMMGRGPMRPARFETARDPRSALSRLAAYLLPFKTAILIVVALVLIYTLLGLLEPYLLGYAIDNFIATKDAAGLARISILLLVIYLLDNGFQAVSAWVMALVSQRALQRLRDDLFQHIQGLKIRFFDTHTTGELMSRLTNDIEAINQAVSQNVVSLIASALSMVGIVIAMFLMDVYLALATLIVVPLMLWFANFVARYTRKGFRDLQLELGGMNSVMEESISGARVIKAFRRNDSAVADFEEHNRKVFKAGVYANSYALLLMPITTQLGNLFAIVLAGMGGYLALKGLVTVGTIAAFISYSQKFVTPLRQIANIYNSIQAALAGAERVFEIIDTAPEAPDAPRAAALESVHGAVSFEDVGFGYLPGKPVIKDFNLQVAAGQTIALVGHTGAGKTTITNLLNRFYDVTSGSIKVDGIDLRQIKRADLRGQLGLVLQDTFLFSDTVMENIRYGRLDASDAEVIEAAKMAAADPFIRQLPQGYQTQLSERASNLSQGQRQMLSIARAILADPGILILDEATSNVDTRTEARIQSALLRLMAGRTSFVIAHRLSTIREADNVVVIDDGRIVEQGKHQELLDKGGFYHNLYFSQFKGQAI